jgi:hypothetical protein
MGLGVQHASALILGVLYVSRRMGHLARTFDGQAVVGKAGARGLIALKYEVLHSRAAAGAQSPRGGWCPA